MTPTERERKRCIERIWKTMQTTEDIVLIIKDLENMADPEPEYCECSVPRILTCTMTFTKTDDGSEWYVKHENYCSCGKQIKVVE